MRFSFFNKLAFFCNLFFVASVVLHRLLPGYNTALTGTVFIIGYFLALLVNPVVQVWALLLLAGPRRHLVRPVWVWIANFVFLLLQLLYIFYLND